jgi:hypothetical protein
MGGYQAARHVEEKDADANTEQLKKEASFGNEASREPSPQTVSSHSLLLVKNSDSHDIVPPGQPYANPFGF